MPYLDVICVAGWGNRLQPLVSGMRLARKYGYTLRVFWPKQVYFPCSFHDLFTNQDFEVSEDQSLYQEVLERKVTEHCYGNNQHDQNDGPIGHFEPTPDDWNVYTHKVFITTGEYMWSQPKTHLDIHEPYLWELQQEFGRLKPVPELTQMIDDTILKLKTDPVVGIHLRKPEVVRLDKFKRRPEFANWNWLPDKTIRCAIDDFINVCPHVSFFLSTNCKPTENRFVKRYGERMITQQKTVRSLLWDYSEGMEWAYHTYTTPQAIKEAFVDLTCLSRTDYIIRNWMSTFSNFASLIRGTNINLKV